MPATNLIEALFDKLDASTAVPVSPELRRQDDPTPAVVYEVTNCAWSLDMSGTSPGHGTMSVKIDCVADSVLSAWALAMAVRLGVDNKWTESGYTFVLTAAEAAMSRANPDDGQADAERVVTLSVEFQFTEDT
jgi:hypothetical protein